MTIRDYLQNRRRKASMVGFGFWIAAVVSMILLGGSSLSGAFFAIAFVGFFITVIILLFGMRCPNCKNNLGYVLSWPPSLFGVSDKIKLCPFCGIGFDTKLADLPKDLRRISS